MKVGRFYSHPRMLDSMVLVKGIRPTGSLVVEWWCRRGFPYAASLDVIFVKDQGDWYDIEGG